MARYTGPVWKVSRRLKYSILGNGKELKKRPYAPGQHGQRRAKLSEYSLQLQEKQKVRFTYGMNEKQFIKFFRQSSKMKGVHGENFLILLESRLEDRKSTRLNSSHVRISYAVFCLKKKKKK